jgi:hypothetical protein
LALSAAERAENVFTNLGQQAIETQARETNLLKEMVGNGYTQFKLVCMSATSGMLCMYIRMYLCMQCV